MRSTESFAAKLLFQFRVVVGHESGKRRKCEERIILIKAKTAREALEKAKRRGLESEHNYLNDEQNQVYFEFIGVLDLLRLGPECDKGDVWYEIKELLLPMERKEKLIPPEEKLNAIYWERKQ